MFEMGEKAKGYTEDHTSPEGVGRSQWTRILDDNGCVGWYDGALTQEGHKDFLKMYIICEIKMHVPELVLN